MSDKVIIRALGRCDYQLTYELMQQFTAARDETTNNEIWLLEHPPVLTLGTSAVESHILDAGNTPVVKTDRGGQVTWHGPGQLMVYLLLDLKPLRLTVKSLVRNMELAVMETLSPYGIQAKCRANAPGVYVDERKISSLGIRVKRGCTYHGLAINISNDKNAFSGINPCGYPGLDTVRVNDLTEEKSLDDVAKDLLPNLISNLNLKNHTQVFTSEHWQQP